MMEWFNILMARLLALFRRESVLRDIEEELRVHVEMETETNIERGMSPDEARAAALKSFGSLSRNTERGYDIRGGGWLETLWQDMRYGLRIMLKNPGFTTIAVLTLALGIGANTAIFSAVNALVFNPLPYPNPAQLVWVTQVFHGNEIIGAEGYLTWQAQSKTFDHMAAFTAGTIRLGEQDDSEVINQVRASASLFPALGVAPRLGRSFTPEETLPGGPPVIILSHDFWQRRFGGDPSVVGRSVPFGGGSRLILGVMPPGFRFLPESRVGGNIDVWEPLPIDPQRELKGEGTSILDNVIGRMKPGVTPEQARSELDMIIRNYHQTHPRNVPPGIQVRVTPLAERLVGHLRRGLLTLFGSVGFVLLIACANVANLLLARANVRQKEMAIRAAVGAGRGRLIRQMLTESLLLSVIGGVAGLLLAWLGVKTLVALAPDNLAQLRVSRIDGSALSFTFLATLLTGVTAGLIPAAQASQIDLNESLKDGARSAIFLKRKSARRVSPALVIGELALTLVLLIGAGLLIKSFILLRSSETGYNPKNLLTLGIPLSPAKYPPGSAQLNHFHEELLTRIDALPGVQGAVTSGALPMFDTGIRNRSRLTVVGRPPEPESQKAPVESYDVSPDYFRVMGMQFRAGRGFTEQDNENSPPVIVVNETLARRYFAGEDPIGKSVFYSDDKNRVEFIIVGVAPDVKRYGLEVESQPEVYSPCPKFPYLEPFILLAVRTAADPLKLAPAVRLQIRELEANQPIFDVMTMEQRLAESVAPRRFQTLLFGLFAAVALVIATVGIYGVISYAVSHRTHEIGIRMALGARGADVLRMVIWRGVSLTLVGVALGLTAALALTRVMKSLLFNVSATDPATFALIALLLVGVALIASYIPARRATKVDPLQALRHE
jgi:putative ABC transport system permease protein